MKTKLNFLLVVGLVMCYSDFPSFAQDLKLNLNRVPFSIAGSYFALSSLNNRIPQDTLYINHFIGYETRQIFKIVPLELLHHLRDSKRQNP